MDVPAHVSEPLEPKPAPPPDAPNQPAPTVTGEGLMRPGGPQTGETLTTSQGTVLRDSDHSLTAGRRGPSLLEDHHLREKVTHFDHERIPERVVHARGAGAHGVFTSYGTAAAWTRARFLAEAVDTPVFVRFSTVIGSRGSADTVRDTRGFATKFYTDEGTFDLVGNNMPVFFIQDGIKFPDIIHAAKWHPDTEIPQAQTAHDTFWDFVSLHTEATHHVCWAMSDRGIPRSYRTMEGFGVNTYRLSDAAGATVLCKWHWKPKAGVHSLLWEEAQLAAGFDPDYHRRDLAEAIASGRFPQWELGLQILPDSPDETFEGIDLLDPTKLVPEELAPVQPVGLLTLNRNPANFFAETEQVAFHVGHLVPGIEPTNDKLLQARLFSYLDTQLSRLGGPNFGQLPINRPRAEVNDNLRDGMHQTQIHTGVAPYTPNTLGGGCPFPGDPSVAFVETPQPITDKVRVRAHSASFDDHFSQAAVFYRSLTTVEQAHLEDAFAFELGKCHEAAIRERMVGVLARVDSRLAASVAAQLGIDPPAADPVGDVVLSPALRQITGEPSPASGRVVGVLAAAGELPEAVGEMIDQLGTKGVTVRLIAPLPGTVLRDGAPVVAERTYATARSIELDALVLAAPDAVLEHSGVTVLVDQVYRHCKPILVLGPSDWDDPRAGTPGVVAGGESADTAVTALLDLLAQHRAWDREALVR
jgi:catalase